MVQLSHPYMTTRKTIALSRGTFVSKVTSLLFNTVWVGHSFSFREQAFLNFMAAVILEPKKIKVSHCFHCFPVYLACHEVSSAVFKKKTTLD